MIYALLFLYWSYRVGKWLVTTTVRVDRWLRWYV